jgi:hypothetical protein
MSIFYILHSPTLEIEATPIAEFSDALKWADKQSIDHPGHVVYVMAAASVHQQEVRAARSILIDITPSTNIHRLQAAE